MHMIDNTTVVQSFCLECAHYALGFGVQSHAELPINDPDCPEHHAHTLSLVQSKILLYLHFPDDCEESEQLVPI